MRGSPSARHKPLMLKEYLFHYFSGRFFRPRAIFEEGRISGFWGDLWGAFDQARPHIRACTSRETGPFVAFPLFRGGDLTFRVYGVDYMAFLKNYPIPQEVKGMADGDSLRQPFFGLSSGNREPVDYELFGCSIPQFPCQTAPWHINA